MEYVVGSVAALISGNVTPNRPKLIRKAFTPTKHQPSPNVTPKSEIEDRSIFLSPTLQKKKAVVKKSPKRIFQNPDSDASDHSDSNSNPTSPKLEKGKRQLKEDLEVDEMAKKDLVMPKSPSNKLDKSSESISMKKNLISVNNSQVGEITSKKKKKQSTSTSESIANVITKDMAPTNEESHMDNKKEGSPKNKKKKRKSAVDSTVSEEQINIIEAKIHENSNKQNNNSKDININENLTTQEVTTENNQNQIKKKNKKRRKKLKAQKNQIVKDSSDAKIEATNDENTNETTESIKASPKKKNKHKNKSKAQKTDDNYEAMETDAKINCGNDSDDETDNITSKKRKKIDYVNPNAITNQESDSEHDSDDEIESENEQINNELLNAEQAESSDDEEEEQKKPEKKIETVEVNNAEEVKRTLFVGNVPFSGKCKKEIKKIFNKYGQIETIRIRTIPVKDARVTPKLAVIKNELHPDRSTVNVYIKYADPTSVDKALVENNTVLKDHHLRVSRSDTTGVQHDPSCSVFIGNMPFALEDEVLRSKFEKCGKIESVRIIRDRKTNAGKGFGYVNFASKDGVELALALSEEDLTIKNRILRVKRSFQTTQKQTQQRDFSKNNQTNQNKGGFQSRNQGDKLKRQGLKEDGQGAQRRIMNKRINQDSADEPPNKRQKNIDQPNKEKKARKEFVGMTSEKKKKLKFNKGQKKKKALSEILTKKV